MLPFMSMLALPVHQLVRQIREHTISPVELLEAHLRRIETVNPSLNAIVNKRYSKARDEAQRAEEAVMRGAELGPLHGIPCTVKEFLAIEGMRHTGGLWVRRNHLARANATLVDRLQAAGAIIMGTTNAPEGGLWHETHNRVYGRTANPHDLTRTSGGSSGGEGAIVAAGGSPFGIGSDVGGSIRIPSAFCGIFGHKPTHGLLPNTGHFPDPPPKPYMACGPMTRSARDLQPLLDVLAGPDGLDPQASTWPRVDANTVDPRELVIYPVPTNGRANVRPEMQAAVMDAAEALQERGASVRELKLPQLKHAFEIWAALMGDLGITYDGLVTDGGRVPLGQELIRWARGRSTHTGAVLTMIALERAMHLLPDQTERMQGLADELSHELETVLGDRGVMLHPGFAQTAPYHRRIGATNPTDVGVTAIFNILQVPVTVAPVGMHQGLPTSVQCIARRGADHLTIAAAMALEDAFGGWRPVEPRRGPANRFPLMRA